MSALVTIEEFYRHGPGAAVWEPLGRRPAQLDAATNRILLPAHGCSTDDPIQLVAGRLIGSQGALPAGLSTFTVYYARIVSSSLLELAASAGGAAVDFTDTGTFGLELQFDLAPGILQALDWAHAAFLACAAQNDWSVPAGGWGGDVKDVECDLVAWPQLEKRGYDAKPNDGYRERYMLAVEKMKAYCAGSIVPLGVVVAIASDETSAPQGFGSSGWGEEPRGFLGQTTAEPRRRAVAC